MKKKCKHGKYRASVLIECGKCKEAWVVPIKLKKKS